MNIKHLQFISSIFIVALTGSCSQKFLTNSQNSKVANRGIASPGEMGKRIGNGGGACVCRENGIITSAELLDFTEAQDKLQIEIANIPMGADSIIKMQLYKLRHLNFLHQSLEEELVRVKSIAQFTLEKETLPLTNDFITTVCEEKLGPKCKYEQAAIYFDNYNALKVSTSIVNKFDSINWAALYIHEAIYKLDRRFTNATDITSEFAKKFVATLFAENFSEKALDKLVESHFMQITNTNGNTFPLLQPHKELSGYGFGYFNEKGLIGDYIIAPKFDSVRKTELDKIYIVTLGDKEGLVDIENGFYIEARFKKIHQYLGLDQFLTEDDSGFNFINSRGDKAFDWNYDFIDKFVFTNYFSGSIAIFRRGNIWGVLNTGGSVLFTTKYKMKGKIQNGLIPFENENGKWGYLDIDGKIAIPAQYVDAMPFSSNGLAAVVVSSKNLGNLKAASTNTFPNFYGYINTSGKMIIQPKFVMAFEFIDNIARVWVDENQKGQFSFINDKGNFITKYKFTSASDFANGIATVQFENVKIDLKLNSDGQIIKDSNEKSINARITDYEISALSADASWIKTFSYGNSFKFDKSYLFPDAKYTNTNCPLPFWAHGETKYGYTKDIHGIITLNGEIKEFKAIDIDSNCQDGFTWIAVHLNKYRAIDGYGNFITKEYEEIRSIKDGLAAAKINGKWGYLNKDGLLVINAIFNEANDFSDGKAIVTTTLNGRKARINKKGVILEYLP